MKFVSGVAVVRINVTSQGNLMWELRRRLGTGEGFALATLNLDHLAKLRRDPAFRDAYALQDLVTADGRPVAWMARLARRPVELLTGADLIRPLAQLAAEEGVAIGFLGSTREALAAAARNLAAEVPGADIRTMIAPPMGFDPEGPEAEAALDSMAASGVRILFLALGAPKQERLAAMGRARRPGLGFVSVGAGLDFWAGTQRRAPVWVRDLALEWLWRVWLEPRRLAARYLRCLLILPGLAARALLDRDWPGPARGTAGDPPRFP